jgi:hypothetical protein
MVVDTAQYPMESYVDVDGGEEVGSANRKSEAVHEDSPLIFEFLKKERRMPSARRLDYMLCVS